MKRVLPLLLLSVVSSSVFAQPIHYNRLPSIEAATYDNNGNDLRGFIKTNKNELNLRGSAVNDYSANHWGYMQIKTVKVPGEDKKGNLNYYQTFDVTLGLYKTTNGAKGTWWAREYNSANAPMLYYKTNEAGRLDMENVKYTDITRELEGKTFTIVEYYDSSLNTKDLDMLLKNTLYIKSGSVKNVEDYKTIIDFYNTFLSKFTTLNDPMLEDKSFITFVRTANARYIGYFNVLNGKLTGRLELLDLQFEAEKPKFVNAMLKNITGKEIYVYGDKTFGMEKTLNKRAEVNNLKLYRKYTTMTGKFNEDK